MAFGLWLRLFIFICCAANIVVPEELQNLPSVIDFNFIKWDAFVGKVICPI